MPLMPDRESTAPDCWHSPAHAPLCPECGCRLAFSISDNTRLLCPGCERYWANEGGKPGDEIAPPASEEMPGNPVSFSQQVAIS